MYVHSHRQTWIAQWWPVHALENSENLKNKTKKYPKVKAPQFIKIKAHSKQFGAEGQFMYHEFTPDPFEQQWLDSITSMKLLLSPKKASRLGEAMLSPHMPSFQILSLFCTAYGKSFTQSRAPNQVCRALPTGQHGSCISTCCARQTAILRAAWTM